MATGAAVFAVPTIWGTPWSIEHFYLRVLARSLLDRPMLLSRLRILEPYGLDFHSDDLDDFSTQFRREELRRLRGELATLRGYDREDQDESQLLSTDVLDFGDTEVGCTEVGVITIENGGMGTLVVPALTPASTTPAPQSHAANPSPLARHICPPAQPPGPTHV